MNSIEVDITDTKLKIPSLERNESESLYADQHVALRSLQNRYNALLTQETLKQAQITRMVWVFNGDKSSRFFS